MGKSAWNSLFLSPCMHARSDVVLTLFLLSLLFLVQCYSDYFLFPIIYFFHLKIPSFSLNEISTAEGEGMTQILERSVAVRAVYMHARQLSQDGEWTVAARSETEPVV